jgi:hypothetical protein
MADEVYANNMEISCKAGSGKTICAMPDVCFTPPQTPATPPGVPVPYPNTGMSSDCSDGSSTISVSGQEVMLKNKSYFKKSTGDEAGAAPQKGVITSSNTGKVYFIAWSMDVMFEGENVVRHLDMTTGNHACPTANAAVPMAHVSKMAPSVQKACADEISRGETACQGQTKEKCSPECKAKQKCLLVPKGKDKEHCCEPDTTGDHQIEDHWIWKDKKAKTLMPDFSSLDKKTPSGNYEKPGGPYDGAPSLCVAGDRYRKQHGVGHGTRGVREDALIGSAEPFTYAKGKAIAYEGYQDQLAYSEKETGAKPECTKKCYDAQLDAFYGSDNDNELHKPERKQALKEEQRQSATDRISLRTPSDADI